MQVQHAFDIHIYCGVIKSSYTILTCPSPCLFTFSIVQALKIYCQQLWEIRYITDYSPLAVRVDH